MVPFIMIALIVIGGGILLLGYAIYMMGYGIAKFFFVGSISNPEADPLLTKAAKWVANNKPEELFELQEYLKISGKRLAYIVQQLEKIGVVSISASNVEKKVNSVWKLGPIFSEISGNKNYFEDQVFTDCKSLVPVIENQLLNANDVVTKRIFTVFLEKIEEIELLLDFSLKKNAGLINEVAYRNKHDDLLSKIGISNLNIQVNKSILDEFSKFKDSFSKLIEVGAWHPVTKIPLTLLCGDFMGIKINGASFEALCFVYNDLRIFIYPTFSIILDLSAGGKEVVKVVDNFYVNTTNREQFFEHRNPSWFDLSQAKFAFLSYLHTRVNGGPDMRYKYNPSFSYYRFYLLRFDVLSLEFLVGDKQNMNNLEFDFCALKTAIFTSSNSQVHDSDKDDKPKDLLIEPECKKKIKNTIETYHLGKDQIRDKSLINILNDYQVFGDPEDKKYFKILRLAMQEDVFSVILEYGSSSSKADDVVKTFVANNGFDAQVTREAIFYICESIEI